MLHFFKHFSIRESHIAYVLATLLCALTAAFMTHYVMKLNYGIPPAIATNPLPAPTSSVQTPTWFLGNDANAGLSAQWRLVGLVAQGPGITGLALLQAANENRARVVRVGQTLPDGAILTAVDIKHATLNSLGNVQTLQLEAPSGSTAVNNSPNRSMDINGGMSNLNMPQGAINLTNPAPSQIPQGIAPNLANTTNAIGQVPVTLPTPAINNSLAKTTTSNFQNNRAVKPRNLAQ